MSAMQCEDLSHDLAGVADGSVRLRRFQRRHVDHCLRCQADLIHYRKLLRSLQSLRGVVIEPAPELLADILDNLEGVTVGNGRQIRSLVSGRRMAYLGGLAAATAAGAVSAIVFTTRTRRARLVS